MNYLLELKPPEPAPRQAYWKNRLRAFGSFDLSSMERHQYLILAVFTIFAGVIRFFRLGEWSFWVDEISTINRVQAHYMDFDSILGNIPPYANWIPISLLGTSAAVKLFGMGEWSARLASAVIGILSIPILYIPTRRIFGTSVALISALLLAVSPWHLYWSQNARFYTSLMLFYALGLFVFYFALERDRLGYLVLFWVITYLGSSERMLFLLIMPAIAAYLLLSVVLPTQKTPGFRIKNFILTGLPLIAGGLIEVYSLVSSGTSRFFGGFEHVAKSIENPFAQSIFIAFEIGIPLLTFSVFSGLFLLSQRQRAGVLILLGAVVPLVLIVIATPFMFTEERYAFITLPCWLTLAAIGVKELWGRTVGCARLLTVGILSLLLADAAGSQVMYFHVNNGNRRDFKGAFAFVQERSGPDDIIVSTFPKIGTYYLDREIVSWQDLDVVTIEESAKRIWFIIIPDMAWYWGNQDVYWWVSHNAELIQVKYLRRPDNADLFVYLYDPFR